MDFITSDKAPKAIGPYSQAVKTGNLLFISGQLPIDPESGEMPEDIRDATANSLSNLFAIVREAGGDIDSIVKVNVFLKNMADFPKMNDVYEAAFNGHKPARAAVEVARLPKDAVIEIEAVAEIL